MTETSRGALCGIRVLDLTRVLAGPLCTMMLGDMGADVIKVEPPGGDDTRRWGPPFAAGESAYFLGANRNKRSMRLNMAVPAGQEVLAGLIEKSDVIIDNFKLGTLPKWGFTDAWFEAHASRAVRCSITGYGSSGPKAALPGYDFVLQAESGLMSICGEPEGTPTKYGVAIVDVCTGMLACNAILAALNARHDSGRGQKVELSLFETSLLMLINVASNVLVAGKGGGRFGNGHPSLVPYTTYHASDAMIALAVGNEPQFAKCAAVCGSASASATELMCPLGTPTALNLAIQESAVSPASASAMAPSTRVRFSTRARLELKRGSSAHSGWPRTAAHLANCGSLPTASAIMASLA